MAHINNRVNAISNEKVGFEPVPTSDRFTLENNRGSVPASELPVVVAARNIKKQKRFKVAKYVISGFLVVSSVALLAIILGTQRDETTETSRMSEEEQKADSDKRQDRGLDQPESRMAEPPQQDQIDYSDYLTGINFSELGRATAEIGMKLYAEEKEKANAGNLLFSPFSIQSALSMVGLGAKGPSLFQLMNLYSNVQSGNVEGSIEGMVEMFKDILPTLQSTQNLTIESANSVFLDKSYNILDTMRDSLTEYFDTSFLTADYEKPEAVATQINKWVEEKTHDKIKDLLNSDSISQDTKMVLVNALYFKGLWENQFDGSLTEEGDFHLDDQNSIKTDFMYQTKEFHVGEYEGNVYVALPYSGQRFVMYLFIPHNVSLDEMSFFAEDKPEKKVEAPLSALEDKLIEKPEAIFKYLDLEKMEKQEISLMLPKFKIEATLPLKENLQKLGVTDLFSAVKADLSGISGSKDLYLSDAIHKAFLEVNEEGSEAAAASAMVISSRSFKPLPLQAHFDRPFIFFIKDEKTKVVLFQGRVVNPTL